MSDLSQVSVTISSSTKEKLDRFTEQQGMKKNFVVEQALLYFMEARRELPDEAFIPTRIVLGNDAFEEVVDQLEDASAPTESLRTLMDGSID